MSISASILDNFLILFPSYKVSTEYSDVEEDERFTVSLIRDDKLIVSAVDKNLETAQLKAFDTVIDLHYPFSLLESGEIKKSLRELKDRSDIKYLYAACFKESERIRGYYSEKEGKLSSLIIGMLDGLDKAMHIIDPQGYKKYTIDVTSQYLTLTLKK